MQEVRELYPLAPMRIWDPGVSGARARWGKQAGWKGREGAVPGLPEHWHGRRHGKRVASDQSQPPGPQCLLSKSGERVLSSSQQSGLYPGRQRPGLGTCLTTATPARAGLPQLHLARRSPGRAQGHLAALPTSFPLGRPGFHTERPRPRNSSGPLTGQALRLQKGSENRWALLFFLQKRTVPLPDTPRAPQTGPSQRGGCGWGRVGEGG